MRIVYFGTDLFAVPALRVLAPHVVAVVTQPDRPSGRGLQLTASPVSQAATELGLPLRKPENARTRAFREEIEALQPDVLVVSCYGQILTERLLASARRGGINLHGSILPRWRGAAPIQRALEAGDTVTGVTVMQMDRGMDTGDIIAIGQMGIGPDVTYGELQTDLAELAASLAAEWIPRVVAGDYQRQPQPAEGTHAPKITPSETQLRWEEPADRLYNRYRAFSPDPGVWAEVRGQRVKVRRLARTGVPAGEVSPGTVLSLNPLVVAASGGAVEWVEVQPAGKKVMAARDWANGLRLRPGDSLSNST